MSRASPAWYVADSPSETVRRAVSRSAERSEIVEVLSEREYPDLERRRVEAIVAAAVGRVERRDEEAARRSTATEERPRPLPGRYADPADVGYLSDDEFARLLSVALERFGGNTFRPEVRDCAADLFWNRSHSTVAVRTVARSGDRPVSEAVLAEVATGDTTPTQGRNPSRVVAVTNASFSAEAVAVAEANDIELYDGSYLGRWLSKARIDRSLAGDVLEHGAKREYDVDERLAEAPTPPEQIRDIDPFEVSVGTRDSPSEASSGRSRSESIPTTEDRPDPGELGSLYADPDEDGDFGAFDRFADRLDEISEDE